jgi:dTDP-4-amino-4,6-dideoxygalactose transaminase
MNVPFFDLSRQYRALKPELDRQVCDTLGECAFIEGPAVKALEEEMEAFLNVRHAISCGNGTDALKIALRALGIKAGDVVITPPFTFFATAEAIAAVGATPVFADIDPDTLNLDPERVEAAVTPKTRAILPVDIFGLPAEMDEIGAIAKRRGLRVVEDACQAVGARCNGRMAGALSDAGCFSFYPTKILGAYGDGGMIVTDSDDTAALCRALKAHGSGRNGLRAAELLGFDVGETELPAASPAGGLNDPCKYYNFLIGENSRLDSVQASVCAFSFRTCGVPARPHAQRAPLHRGPGRYPPAAARAFPEGKVPCWHQYAVMAPTRKRERGAFAAHVGTARFTRCRFTCKRRSIRWVTLPAACPKPKRPAANRSACRCFRS